MRAAAAGDCPEAFSFQRTSVRSPEARQLPLSPIATSQRPRTAPRREASPANASAPARSSSSEAFDTSRLAKTEMSAFNPFTDSPTPDSRPRSNTLPPSPAQAKPRESVTLAGQKTPATSTSSRVIVPASFREIPGVTLFSHCTRNLIWFQFFVRYFLLLIRKVDLCRTSDDDASAPAARPPPAPAAHHTLRSPHRQTPRTEATRTQRTKARTVLERTHRRFIVEFFALKGPHIPGTNQEIYLAAEKRAQRPEQPWNEP